MKKLLVPVCVFVIAGCLATAFQLAICDLEPRFGVGAPPVDLDPLYPHYLRVRPFMPAKWRNYLPLAEEINTHGRHDNVHTDKGIFPTIASIKRDFGVVMMNGDMIRYLEVRKYWSIMVMMLAVMWLREILRRPYVVQPTSSTT